MTTQLNADSEAAATPDRGWPSSAARRARVAVSTAVAAVLGLLPHVLHHAGPFAGAALFSGVAGSLLFGALGLLLSIPLLLRVHRHGGNWRTPALLLATFAAVFSLSTFVIGPAISGRDDGSPSRSTPAPSGAPAPAPSGHEQHHR